MTSQIKTRIFLLTLLFAGYLIPTSIASYEVDATSYVTEVIDGDSFYIQGDEVRLADVSCPEWYEEGGPEATEALTNLIEGQYVYLDTDQKSGRDPYDRLVAVVYVVYNETHLMNVNAAMLLLGYADLTDYTNNEFDPMTWFIFETYNSSDTESDVDDDLVVPYYEYEALYNEYSGLVDDYNDMRESYLELLDEFTELNAANTELQAQYDELYGNYTVLLEQQESGNSIPGFSIFPMMMGIVLILLLKKKSSI